MGRAVIEHRYIGGARALDAVDTRSRSDLRGRRSCAPGAATVRVDRGGDHPRRSGGSGALLADFQPPSHRIAPPELGPRLAENEAAPLRWPSECHARAVQPGWPPVLRRFPCSCCSSTAELEPPTYAHPGDAGADLHSAEDLQLEPGERRLVGTGVAIALPEGLRGFRSSAVRVGRPARHQHRQRARDRRRRLSRRDQGVPDQYRSGGSVSDRRGDRIAQLVIQPVSRASFVPVTELPDSSRGIGGYGSTGGILGTSRTSQEHER